MTFKNKIIIIALIMLVLCSVSFASAAQDDLLSSDDADEALALTDEEIQTESINDENISQSNQDVLSDSQKSYDELQDRIDKLDPGVTLKLNSDYAHTGEIGHIEIKKDVSIDGQGHYISGENSASVFKIVEDDVTLTLRNIVFKNGASDNGGVIHTKNDNVNINIINCTFTDNYAIEDGGAIYFDSTGTLDIKNTRFEKCITQIVDSGSRKRNGGAINVQNGKLNIDNCTFTNNTAGFGYAGAIYLKGETDGIRNSVFEYNTARSRFGGAIYVDTSNANGLAVDNCIFTNNTSIDADRKMGSGGAIYYEGSGLVRLTNSNFTGNLVLGEATYNKDAREASRTSYTAKGGAVSSIHDIEIGNCTFIKNHAVDQGGAVNTDEAIRWIGTAIFKSNTVGHSNVHLANKGGAVYAQKFHNDAEGLIFIDNHAWYGGAVYLNNKVELTFESCVFINNSVWNNDGKEACGAAIYMDSSSSKLSLINNIIYNNHATNDRGVYNCGNYATIKNNWYGFNDVNFDDSYLVEWHRVGSNDNKKDSNSLRITLSANQTEVFHSSVKLTLKFVCSDKTEFTGKLTDWTVDFKSSNNGVFKDLQIGDNEATVIFTPEAGDHVITAKVHGQEVSVNLSQMGDFTWLQKQINDTPEGGVLNLNNDLTFNPSQDSILFDGVKITKAITINGNGYKIDGLNNVRVFLISSNDVEINNVTFVNGNYRWDDGNGGGAIFIHDAGNVSVRNSIFINNKADRYGGAIAVNNGSDIQVMNSQFINNTAPSGGAISMSANNVTVDGCEFTNNIAEGYRGYQGGGAIASDGENVVISNSIFLKNKADSNSIKYDISENKLILTLVGLNNYINAIQSNNEIKFSNVTYWDGAVTTGSNPVHSENESGQGIVLEIYNSNSQLVKKVNLVTDVNGQATYDYSILENGNYTFKATHLDNEYYTEMRNESGFSLNESILNKSKVKINIDDDAQFYYGNCNISFEITNRTIVDVYITNNDSSIQYTVNATTLNYVLVELPASNSSYTICVYNYGDDIIGACSEYKTFKILKSNSTVTINPVSNVDYGENVSVSFAGDCKSYNVTVYNKTNDIVFSQIINEKSVEIPKLVAGEYNVTVVNLGNNNKTQSKASATFKVLSVENHFKVDVTATVYGKDVTVTVTADVDGEYSVDINSSVITVKVVNGSGSEIIPTNLKAGNYYANVTFEDENYNNTAVNAEFTIQKGQSEVKIVDLGNVTYNQTKTIRLSDFYIVKYNVTIYNSGNDIEISEITDSLIYTIPILKPGEYNITVTNLGNDNVLPSQTSQLFTVVKENNIAVYVDDTDYGRQLYIAVLADVDGYYTVNINGTEFTVEVVNGSGEYYDLTNLTAGHYIADVIYDNPDYTNVINNTEFDIHAVESNLKIYPIEDVAYGNDVTVRFHDDYPTSYLITVTNQNNQVALNITFKYEGNIKDMKVLLAEFDAGQYTVSIESFGDENIAPNSDSTTFNILKTTPVIQVSAEDVIYPDDIVVNVIVDVNGTYVVTLADQSAEVKLESGVINQLVFSGIEEGQYIINVSFAETPNHNAAVNDTVDVIVFEFEFDMDSESSDDGNTTLNIAVPGDAKGKIIVTVNGTNYTGDVVNGTARVTIPNLKDDDEIIIAFISDEKYPNKTENTTKNLIDSKFISKDLTRGFNSGMDFEVKLVDGSNNPMANATVTYTINGKKYSAVTDANGIITINQKLPVGSYSIELTNPFNNAKTLHSLKIVTRITDNKNVNTYYGKNYQYKVRIIGDDGNPVGAGVAVKVTVNGKAKTLKSDKNGYVTFKFTKAYLPKTYTVTVEYKDVKVSNKVAVKKVLTLKKVKVKRSAKKLKLTATLKEGKKAVKSKKVTFKFNGKKYTAKTNKKGVAKVIIKKKVLKKLKVGKKVKYQVTYLKHTVKRTVKVKR